MRGIVGGSPERRMGVPLIMGVRIHALLGLGDASRFRTCGIVGQVPYGPTPRMQAIVGYALKKILSIDRMW